MPRLEVSCEFVVIAAIDRLTADRASDVVLVDQLRVRPLEEHGRPARRIGRHRPVVPYKRP
jgi:hypothetical protein